MKNSNYSPIILNTTRDNFFSYVDSLDIPQIDYVAVGVQNVRDKKSISLMSMPEWQRRFVENAYAEHDPVRRITLSTKRNIIPFSEIDCLDNFGKEIMNQRRYMGIKDGIILMQRFPKYNYIITLGTGFSNFDAYDFLKKYHNKINFLKSDLITLIGRDATEFLPREIRDIRS